MLPLRYCHCEGNRFEAIQGMLIDNFDLWETAHVHPEFQYYFPLDPFANGEGLFDAVGYAPDFHARGDMSF